MYARKHEPDTSEQLAAAVDQTVGTLVRVLADAQQRGEIIDGDPEELNLVTGAALHGMAGFISAGWLTPEAALAGVEDLVHHLLNGLRPR